MSGPRRADGLADADLAGPLPDAHEHDVHDPDLRRQGARSRRSRRQQGEQAGHRRDGVEQLRLVADAEVRVAAVGPVAGLEQRRHRRLHGVDRLGGGHAEVDRRHRVPGDEVALGGRDRDDHHVVAGALRLEDPDDAERDAADEDLGPDVVRREAEIVGRGGPEDRDVELLRDRDVGQERALPDLVRPDVEVLGRAADHRRRRVLVARDHDRLRRGARRDRRDVGELRDRLGVVEGERRRRPGALAHEAAGHRSRHDGQEVRAEVLDAVRDPARRPLGDRDEGDDRADADDDAEHRQDGPQARRGEPAHGELDELEVLHGTSRPSRTWTWRVAATATSESWVISTIVVPTALSSWRSRSTFEAGRRVEVAGRLVGEDQHRARDQRPGDGDALLLAAGELGRLVVEPVAEPEALERSPRALRPLVPRDALVDERRGDVLERGRPREEVERLEDEADGAAPDAGQVVVVERPDLRPGEPVAPGCRPIEAADDVHQRRLAAAGRPDDRQEVAGADVEVDAPEGGDLEAPGRVDPRDVPQLDDRCLGGGQPGPGGVGVGRGEGGVSAQPARSGEVTAAASGIHRRAARRPGGRRRGRGAPWSWSWCCSGRSRCRSRRPCPRRSPM